MASSNSIDLISLERHLLELLQTLRASGSDVSWLDVQKNAQEIANHLRVRDSLGECLLFISIRPYVFPCICFHQ